MGKYFGTDGIRGLSGETLTAELAYKVGCAIKEVLNRNQLVLGMDTRASSMELSQALAQGFFESGGQIIFAGVVPTPVIAHYAKEHQITGVMITASHNPYQYNGIKVFYDGYKLTQEVESQIEEVIDEREVNQIFDFKLQENLDVYQSYEKIYGELDLSPMDLRVGLDCANGATYEVAKKLFSKWVSNLSIIGNKPNGFNINLDVGSTHPDAITNLVYDQNLDIGFSFDGDGDRIVVVDSNGYIYDGDHLVYIIATYLNERGLLKDSTVVLTKMSNPGILKVLNQKGIQTILTDVGDKYIQAILDDQKYSIGGESSGHLILPKYLHSGDGILVAMLLLKILSETKKTLRSLIFDLEVYPFKLINLKGIDRNVLTKQSVRDVILSVEKRLGSDALLLIRPSGTEPLLRIAISHRDSNVLDTLLEELIQVIEKEGKIQ